MRYKPEERSLTSTADLLLVNSAFLRTLPVISVISNETAPVVFPVIVILILSFAGLGYASSLKFSLSKPAIEVVLAVVVKGEETQSEISLPPQYVRMCAK